MGKKTSRSEVEWPGRDSWSAGSVWLAYTLFWGFMPFWLGALGLGVLAALGFPRHGTGWSDFLIHGEFLIYAASVTASATRLISSDINPKRPFAFRAIFNLVAYAVIVPSAAAYAMIKVLSLSNPEVHANVPLMVWFSVPMVIIGVLFSFLVFVFDHHRTTTPLNVVDEIKKEEDALSQEFDRLEVAGGDGRPEDVPGSHQGGGNG